MLGKVTPRPHVLSSETAMKFTEVARLDYLAFVPSSIRKSLLDGLVLWYMSRTSALELGLDLGVIQLYLCCIFFFGS